jgi:acetyl-CoA carboxylase biotin carboxylase subunit
VAAIRTLLVANRGEISGRIQRTAQAMGISTVAVFSDADARAPFVKMADRAVRLGPAPASESYLCIDRLLDAARLTGADAVHPGFGFLAENAEFARACEQAGLVFVGPRSEAIRAMGSKREAKRIASAAGVPVVPGVEMDDQSVPGIARRACELGFPLLLKASAGGGGKGMRILRSAEGLEAAIESAKREALSAFSDDTLIVERYLERPRHVEIQILGDHFGNLVHLFERECSIQRRHQKIVEESPSPALDSELRRRMGEAAISVARAVGYTNAGTVELMLAPDRSFYFLEVNTRLQVEHPVTELVTGLDIVREQIRIAEGEPLGFGQDELAQHGHAIECRLYAEDPAHGFLPTTGTIVDWHFPQLPGLRIDSGVETGSEVGIHYDPMLAKLIVHAKTRTEAIRKLVRVLRTASVQGLVTNLSFLARVLEHPEFVAGNSHTHFIQEHLAEAPPDDPRATAIAAIATTLASFERSRRERAILPALAPGFRNNPSAPQVVDYKLGDRTLRVSYASRGAGGFDFEVAELAFRVAQVEHDGATVRFVDADGLRHAVRVTSVGARHHTQQLGHSELLLELPRFPEPELELAKGACVAPMPGKVVAVLVGESDHVTAGQTLVVLEAMKMEHAVKATADGRVERVLVSTGEQVEADAVLVVLSPEDEPSAG